MDGRETNGSAAIRHQVEIVAGLRVAVIGIIAGWFDTPLLYIYIRI
jgi:hypothetical protein